MNLKRVSPTLIAALLPIAALDARAQEPREDLLIADFEAADYGAWQVTGEAFGPGPARGTLPGQMQVSGFRGEGLVNSFFGGDGTTGSLTSPPFEVERRYLSFLIGGGGYEGTTCVNLLHRGEVVRTAVGPNLQPGGSEELAPWAWDLEQLAGESVTLQVVDARTGGWGHVNLDHVVLTDVRPEIPERPERQERELLLSERYLLIPVRGGARPTRVDLRIDGNDVRQFDVELAGPDETVDFWAHLDVEAFRGCEATLVLSAATEAAAARIALASVLPTPDDLYDEPLRPQLRFSQRLGWNNDPNGMVYLAGEWHLFFQHNPYGWRWGNMHWGHAVSRDLLHWEQLPIAIYPGRHGDWAFSGGAMVDERNSAGWQTGSEPVIVASWTSTGRGECLAYSNDRGRTFVEYEGNPVVRHQGRDPKIIWYAPGEHWVMAVYSQVEERRTIAFHTSKDLKSWKLASHLDGYYECPEIFELPVDGDPQDTRWVVFAADGRYALGGFDGQVFTPLHEGKHRLHYGSYYASQTFSNAPGERRIQIGWARIAMPGMPFNQAFSFPHELTLRTTPDGVRMFAEPVEEIEGLRRGTTGLTGGVLSDRKSFALGVAGELFDIRATFELRDAASVGFELGGDRIVYDVAAGKLGEAELSPVDGRIEIRVLVDRPLLEIIGNRGRVYVTSPRTTPGELTAIRAFARGGSARILDLEVHELSSIWSSR